MSAAPSVAQATAIEDASSIIVSDVSPIASTEVSSIQIEPIETSPLIVDTPEEVVSSSPEVHEVSLQVQDTHTEAPVDLSNLFWSSDEETVSVINTPSEVGITEASPAIIPEITIADTVSGVSISSDDEFSHPHEFIEMSLEKVRAMILSINKRHDAKLEEALGYKTEKEKYASLEEATYEEAEKLIWEREHAESMESYFQSQLEKLSPKQAPVTEQAPPAALPSSSVETTLTGLAVQNTVTEVVEKSEQPSETPTTAPSEWLLALAS